MATYYWVGGAGTWNNSATTNWASSSGGAGGAGVPTSADNVVFDTSSGTGDVDQQSTAVCNDLTVTATQALRIGTAFNNLTIYGSLSISSGAYVSLFTQTGFVFAATTTGKTINANNNRNSVCIFDGVGGGWTFLSTMQSFTWTLTNGTLNTNGYNIAVSNISYSATGTFNLTLGTSTLSDLSGPSAWSFASTTGLTFSGASSTITLRNTGFFSTTTFAGGGLTYGNLVFNNISSGTRYFDVTGANTFTGTMSSTSLNSITLTFPSSVTTTMGEWTVSGSSTLLVTLQSSSAGTQATLSKSGSGLIASVNYLSVKDINGAPSNIWYVGRNSTNVSNNTNVYFADGYNLNVSESITSVTDIRSTVTTFSSNVTEPITSEIDLVNANAAFLLAITEPITDVTGIDSGLRSVFSSTTEDLVVYDASTTVASFVANASESTTLIDYPVGNGIYPISAIEALALNDVETIVKIHNASTEEPISVLYVTDRFGWGPIDNTESTEWVLIDNRQ